MKRPALRAALSLMLTAAAVAAGCGGEEVAPGAITADSAPSSAPIIPEGAMGHGSHDPKHNGVVLMSDAYHFEVVLEPSGEYAVYFTDMARNDLPATTASAVTITIKRPAGAPPETIPLKIDESGEGWIGKGRPVDNIKETIANISYTARGAEKPYAMDLEFWAAQPQPPASLARPEEPAAREQTTPATQKP
jgi:hypothetical protein